MEAAEAEATDVDDIGYDKRAELQELVENHSILLRKIVPHRNVVNFTP